MLKVLTLGYYSGTLSIYEAQIELLIGLQKKGCEITVLAHCSDEIYEKFNTNSIRVIDDSPQSKTDSAFINRLRELIIKEKFDILHVFSSTPLRNAIKAIKSLPIKLVTYMGSTSIYWHDISSYNTYLNPRIDAIICNSKYVEQHLKKQLFGKNKDKTTLIYKGYDISWFTNIAPFDFGDIGIPKNAIVVTMAATFMKVKGIQFFIKATHFIPKNANIHFVLMGDKTDTQKIKKWVSKSPLQDNIHILGFRKDAKSIIKGTDIYVQTSLSEGFGRALSEAVIQSRPVVMTDAGGCTELIVANESGIITPKKDSKKIAEAILSLAQNKELRKKLGQNAKNRIETYFNTSQTVQKTLELYQKLIKN
jgi:glycosyltransferase involved in cell wall biosynthesis